MDHLGWVNMRHGLNSHYIKLARSDYHGYYFIYNKDCSFGDYPNRETKDNQIQCLKPSPEFNYSGHPEYNWLFVERQQQLTPSPAPVHQLDRQVDDHHNHVAYLATIAILAVSLVASVIFIVLLYYWKYHKSQSYNSYGHHIYHIKANVIDGDGDDNNNGHG
ncbi:uncharacterized protein LOC128959838 [Oppia nitens]|uniref:uncharacterized protein LOC128959838 n=1 Tax=Oppia nitens TaxID=1686743 RepID=UPI0023DA55EC|nr:uncharacterized protein LOC128959838 [Oppia nitens]